MTARESGATERARKEAETHPLRSLTDIAKRHEIAISTLRRAMRRAGHKARPVPSGELHPHYRGS